MEENFRKNQDFITEMNTIKVRKIKYLFMFIRQSFLDRETITNEKSDAGEGSCIRNS